MSRRRFNVTVPKLAFIALLGLGLGGCAGLSGLSPSVSFLIGLLTLVVGGIVGCTEPAGTEGDGWTVGMDGGADVVDATDVPDATDTDGRPGTWQPCCKDGEIESCFCPAEAFCNYGFFKRCGGNKCVAGPRQFDAGCPIDAGDTSDAGDVPDSTDTARGEGRWQRCCEDGEVSTCFCPAGVACNYGLFKSCGGGKCVPRRRAGDVGCPVDAGDATTGS